MAYKAADSAGRKAVDWGDVARRDEAPGRTAQLTSEQKRGILRARAKELARPEAGPRASRDGISVLEFALAHERYAVEVSHVEEACTVKDITFLPGVDPFVMGIVNVRGRILSVIDLKKFFDLPDRGLADQNRLIILRREMMEIGILADAIVGVRTLAADQLQPSLPTLTGLREEYLKGIAPDGLIVLDAARLLSDKRIVVHEEV